MTAIPLPGPEARVYAAYAKNYALHPIQDLAEVDWDNYAAHLGDETDKVGERRRTLTGGYFRDVGAAWDDDEGGRW